MKALYIPFKAVSISFLQCAWAWLLSCPHLGCSCYKKCCGFCEITPCAAVLATLQRGREIWSLCLLFKSWQSHLLHFKAVPHDLSRLTEMDAHARDYSVSGFFHMGEKHSHSWSFGEFSNLQSHFPCINLIWFLGWFMGRMFSFLIFRMMTLRFGEGKVLRLRSPLQ